MHVHLPVTVPNVSTLIPTNSFTIQASCLIRILYAVALIFIAPVAFFTHKEWFSREWSFCKSGTRPPLTIPPIPMAAPNISSARIIPLVAQPLAPGSLPVPVPPSEIAIHTPAGVLPPQPQPPQAAPNHPLPQPIVPLAAVHIAPPLQPQYPIRVFDESSLNCWIQTRHMGPNLYNRAAGRINGDMSVLEAAHYLRLQTLGNHPEFNSMECFLITHGIRFASFNEFGNPIIDNPEYTTQNFMNSFNHDPRPYIVFRVPTQFNDDSLSYLFNYLRQNHNGDELSLTLTSRDNELFRIYFRANQIQETEDRIRIESEIIIQNTTDPNKKIVIRTDDTGMRRFFIGNEESTFTDLFDKNNLWSRRLASFARELQISGHPEHAPFIPKYKINHLLAHFKTYPDTQEDGNKDEFYVQDHEGLAYRIRCRPNSRGSGYSIIFTTNYHFPGQDSSPYRFEFDNDGNLSKILKDGEEQPLESIYERDNELNKKLAGFYRRLIATGTLEEAEPPVIEGANPLVETLPPHQTWLNIIPNHIRTKHIGEVNALTLASGDKIWCSNYHGGYQLILKKPTGDTFTIVIGPAGQILNVEEKRGEYDLKEFIKADNDWNILMNQFFDAILCSHGVRTAGNTIYAHNLAIERCPEAVLNKVSSHLTAHMNVRFLRNDFTVTPGIDAGGPSRDFIGKLGISLFTNENNRKKVVMKLEEDFMPNCTDDLAKTTFQNYGKLISCVLLKPVVTGYILSPKFFEMIKYALSSSDQNILLTHMARIKNLGTSTYSQLEPVLEWYNAPNERTKEAVINYLRDILSVDDIEQTISNDQLKLHIKENILDNYQTQLDAVLAVLSGLTIPAKNYFQTTSAEAISDRIQGIPISSAQILASMQARSNETGLFGIRMGWLRNFIQNKSADSRMLQKFVRFITGSPALMGNAKLGFVQDTLGRRNFHAHTCFNYVDVPLRLPEVGFMPGEPADMSEEERFVYGLELDLLAADEGFSTG